MKKYKKINREYSIDLCGSLCKQQRKQQEHVFQSPRICCR